MPNRLSPRLAQVAAATLALALLCPLASQARVTRIVIDDRVPVPAASSGAIAYEQIFGRAFGELDPALPGNAIVQDIALAKEADGKVRYVASFQIVKPVDIAKASGLMWHDVPNRGNFFAVAPQEFAFGDVLLGSAWQGDNAGNTAVKPSMQADGKHWLQLPVAKGPARRCPAAHRQRRIPAARRGRNCLGWARRATSGRWPWSYPPA